MIDFLNALKADLLDRRLLPFVALVGVALLATVAYVAIGGGSSSPTPTAAATPAATGGAGSHLAVSQTTSENPPAETTEGTSSQHQGVARNPFVPLPSQSTTSTTASPTPAPSSSSSSSASTTTGSGSSSTTTTTTKETKTTTTTKKSTKPQVVYNVAVLFGQVPAGSAPLTSTELTPYLDLKLATLLPPKPQQPLIVYRGVTTGGHSATFSIAAAVILSGSANCLPNASQCEAIDLKPGQSERMEFTPETGGASVVYELRVVSIAASTASTARLKSLERAQSKAGRELLRREGLVAIPYLHYSEQFGVLAFATRPASAARAHAAAHR